MESIASDCIMLLSWSILVTEQEFAVMLCIAEKYFVWIMVLIIIFWQEYLTLRC